VRHEAALAARRRNPVIKAFCDEPNAAGKRPTLARVARMHRRLTAPDTRVGAKASEPSANRPTARVTLAQPQ